MGKPKPGGTKDMRLKVNRKLRGRHRGAKSRRR